MRGMLVLRAGTLYKPGQQNTYQIPLRPVKSHFARGIAVVEHWAGQRMQAWLVDVKSGQFGCFGRQGGTHPGPW